MFGSWEINYYLGPLLQRDCGRDIKGAYRACDNLNYLRLSYHN